MKITTQYLVPDENGMLIMLIALSNGKYYKQVPWHIPTMSGNILWREIDYNEYNTLRE